ncbi:methionine aminotransferase [Aurantibacillus circumpalustris]|uniref:methionine aminotransferase n=1 Tax=Aurantibacillus circumpalustris TaxID=3036359 RepID=UPI00295AAED3|nr:methionine aminotransferase [Aurantibacillus circumpalustris]
MKIKSKLPNIGTTIFTTMSALAREHNAINLSQGFPDYDCSPKLKEAATHYINTGYNQYAPMAGTIQLRERVAEIISLSYGSNYDPDSEITITAGATQAIYTAIAAFIHKGDEVIVFEPAYDCYVPAIEVHGGIAVYSQLKANDFSINWEDVRKKITQKTKAILINSPHNPSGTTITAKDILELEKIISGSNILVISDEVYEHMVFDGETHNSVAKSKILKQQSILISSFGKTIHTTGWKIGYVAAPKEIMNEFRKIHQFLVFVVNHPLQLAIADFLADKTNYTELKKFYQAKRDLFLKLTASSRFVPLKTSGTYFQLMSYKNLSDESDTELAIRLTVEKKLATIPLSVFYSEKTDNKLLRFCFAKKDETLEKAAEIICNI